MLLDLVSNTNSSIPQTPDIKSFHLFMDNTGVVH